MSDNQTREPSQFSKEECAIYLCGYMMGLALKTKTPIDPIVINCLRKLGVSDFHLEMAKNLNQPKKKKVVTHDG